MVLALASRLSALVGLSLLAACAADTKSSSSDKHLRPLSYATVKDLSAKGLAKEDPILVRIYKQESEFEVWKQAKADGKYKHFKTYKICKWSGGLGPKVKIGDKQAPEGFYSVAPGQMNPKSSYYLSFNTGFPNPFDKSHGRTGEHLMVHGDCLSAGCYAMTDEQMQEIYALARDALAGGQQAFQIQALPFRMTAENLAKHRGNANMAFWQNLKEGHDHFEVTRAEPKVAVCGRKYVFNPEAPGAQFTPTEACPAYSVPEPIATAVAAKQKSDEAQTQVMVARLEDEQRQMIAAAQPSSILTALAGRSRPAAEVAPAVAAAPSAPSALAAAAQVPESGTPQPAVAAARATAAEPASGVSGFFSRLTGRGGADPAAASIPAGLETVAPASAPAPAPRPKPADRQAFHNVLPTTLGQQVRPRSLSAFRQ